MLSGLIKMFIIMEILKMNLSDVLNEEVSKGMEYGINTLSGECFKSTKISKITVMEEFKMFNIEHESGKFFIPLSQIKNITIKNRNQEN